MRTNVIPALLLVGLTGSALAQAPILDWQRCFGGALDDLATVIIATSDGGVLMACTANSSDGDFSTNHGEFDAWLVKLDVNNALQWKRNYGGSGTDNADALLQLEDGGYLLATSTDSPELDPPCTLGLTDIRLIRTDANGEPIWVQCLGGGHRESAQCLMSTDDGGFLLAGETNSLDGDVSGQHGYNDGWLARLDDAGNILWQRCIGGTSSDRLRSASPRPGGGWMAVGSTDSEDGDLPGNQGGYDLMLAAISAQGELEWVRNYGGSAFDFGTYVHAEADGTITAIGHASSNNGDCSGNHGEADLWILRTDAAGNLIEQHMVGGSQNDDSGSAVRNADGSYTIAGGSRSSDGDVPGNQGLSDTWLVRVTPQGVVLWSATFGGPGVEYFTDLCAMPASAYCAIGTTSSDFGDVSNNHGQYDVWALRTGTDFTSIEAHAATPAAFTVFPNPVGNVLQLHGAGPLEPSAAIRVRDQLGREVLSAPPQLIAEGSWRIHVAGLPPGFYTATFKALGPQAVRFVKE